MDNEKQLKELAYYREQYDKLREENLILSSKITTKKKKKKPRSYDLSPS